MNTLSSVAAAPGASHLRCLQRLYREAPVSRWYGSRIEVGDGAAEVRLTILPEFHHAARAVHGSVYFRALDDAAFFAANSREPEVLLTTVGFQVQFLRPISHGALCARGALTHQSGRLFFARAELYDDRDRLLATGSGTFTRSRIALDAAVGYCDPSGR